MRKLGVFSGKGGVGKTTVSINLAATLAHDFSKNVLLVEGNVTTPHLGHFLDLKPEDGRTEVFPRLYVDAYPESLEKIREEIRISQGYDFMILDTAPGLTETSNALTEAVDEILVVTSPKMDSIVDVLRLKENIDKDSIIHGMVYNRVKNKGYEVKPEKAERKTGLPVIEEIPEDKRIGEMNVFQEPVIKRHRDSEVHEVFSEISEYVL